MNRRYAANQAAPVSVIASRALVCPTMAIEWSTFGLDHPVTGHKLSPRSSVSPP